VKAFIVMLVILTASGAHADTWLTTTHHEGDLPLYVASQHGFYDGNQLWNQCNNIPASYAYMVCVGYIVGVADVLVNENSNNVCLPSNATQAQVADVVTKYLRDYPERRHFLAYSTVAVALADAFPCSARP